MLHIYNTLFKEIDFKREISRIFILVNFCNLQNIGNPSRIDDMVQSLIMIIDFTRLLYFYDYQNFRTI